RHLRGRRHPDHHRPGRAGGGGGRLRVAPLARAHAGGGGGGRRGGDLPRHHPAGRPPAASGPPPGRGAADLQLPLRAHRGHGGAVGGAGRARLRAGPLGAGPGHLPRVGVRAAPAGRLLAAVPGHALLHRRARRRPAGGGLAGRDRPGDPPRGGPLGPAPRRRRHRPPALAALGGAPWVGRDGWRWCSTRPPAVATTPAAGGTTPRPPWTAPAWTSCGWRRPRRTRARARRPRPWPRGSTWSSPRAATARGWPGSPAWRGP